ncbi:imidazolonepropionase [Sphingomonas sp. ID1715]|uniref:imidazolonepropionase n=1 Tax=Sphingomonas sp. ID1715 TaxID=1656898 RepID=UPI0014892278|nr:imidazolonepropionase [Sphingomonas sp. ID1715]NNM75579.1 imidazolonepropionase [Sphingomonas sp. ID1715]
MAAADRWDRLWVNVRLATMVDGGVPYGAVERGALAVAGGRIAFAGPADDLPKEPSAAEVIDAGGRWMTPGLIDCHTHIVFGGDRIDEYEARLKGASYEEIARAGGGIVSTVRATRAASEDELVQQALPRLRQLIGEGVTTIEIKSGYGLDTDNELKMLRAARRLGRELPIHVRTTFLGAHALPPEFAHDRAGYIDLVCQEMLPRAAREGLVDAVDAFCETIGFTAEETARLFDTATRLGIPVKLHSDQLSDGGGAGLAARYQALSADHVEWTSTEGVEAMAKAGTVAVLLPGAFLTLRETKLPPVDIFRAAGVPMALATDCNPGTSPARSLLLMLNLACTLFRMTPEEALAGVTRNAASALGLADRGTLEIGKRADLVLWDISSPAELCYWLGGRPELEVIRASG